MYRIYFVRAGGLVKTGFKKQNFESVEEAIKFVESGRNSSNEFLSRIWKREQIVIQHYTDKYRAFIVHIIEADDN